MTENDTVHLQSKKSAAETIKPGYADLGWRLINEREDGAYSDVVHLSFSRPHAIQNKDGLQLLQVRMDIAFNNMGDIVAKSKRRATYCGLFAAFSALFFTIEGAMLLAFYIGALSVALGAVSFAFAAASVGVGVLICVKIYKNDCAECKLKIEEEVKKFERLRRAARKLRGLEDESV